MRSMSSTCRVDPSDKLFSWRDSANKEDRDNNRNSIVCIIRSHPICYNCGYHLGHILLFILIQTFINTASTELASELRESLITDNSLLIDLSEIWDGKLCLS